MDKKNVMLLMHSLTVGGTERSVSNISKLLCERYNVFVAVFNGKSQVMDIGGRLIDLRQPMGCWWQKPLVAARRIFSLRRAVRSFQIDALLGFTPVCCRYIAFAPRKVKRVLCVRGFMEITRMEACYAFLLRRCDCLLFNSRAAMRWFAVRHERLAGKVAALENCVDIGAVPCAPGGPGDAAFQQFAQNRVVIVSVGRLHVVKGFDFLIKAFLLLRREMPDIGLLIVGDGPAMPELQKLAKAGGDSVLFAGLRDNPLAYMAASRLYVLPSRSEGFPNALVEAMACGVPVIAADCDTGPREILCDAYDDNVRVAEPVMAPYGMLVPPPEMPPDDCPDRLEPAHHHLADAMKVMLSDQALRARYQEAGRQRALRFSFENSAARYAEFIDTLCKGAI